ncbi:MAG: AAA family ATPase [Acidimicrobiia bacterium]|nr:AAA family ATPase [Acidimicrobiia bacterium]
MTPSAASSSDPQSLLRPEFYLLGPVSAWIDGAAVSLGGPRQAAVLARLLLTPRHVVSLDQFVDSIWDNRIPSRPDVAIRSYISNLRRLIEPDRKQRGHDSILTSASAGYRLDLEPSQIDWVRFERAVNNARAMLHNGEYAAATGELRGANTLWQGEPLSGVPDSEFFSAHRNRLEELRAVALEFMYEAQLGRGDHLSVAADIEQAIAGHPFRERLTELGMIALYRSGRQSAALALGQQLRQRLVDSLGIDPSPRIANIELQILNHDPQLREHRPDPGPSPGPSSRGNGGYGSDVLDGIDGANPGGRALGHDDLGTPAGTRSARITGQWFLRRPTDGATIFGRHEELAEIAALRDRLDDGRLAVAVITGEPGVGKTALMTEAARRLASDRVPVTTAVGTEFAAPKFWLWRQVVADLANRKLGPAVADSPRDQARFAPLHALGPNIEGALGLAPPSSGAGYDDEAVMMAIVDYVGAVGEATPLIVVIDDLHRADQRSVDTLRYLISRLGQLPMTVLVAWQQATLPPEQPRGLRDLATLPHVLRVGLAGLDLTAICELADQLDQRLETAEAHDLREATAGNPALIQELLRRRQSDAGADGDTGQPLQESTVGQIDQLGAAADWILAVAATFDGSFALKWVADLVESPPSDSPQSVVVDRGHCRDIIRAAVSQGFLVELPDSGWFEFRHRIMREALVETLLAVDRAWLHGHIGRRFLAEGDRLRALCNLAAGAKSADRTDALELGLRLSGAGPGFVSLGDEHLGTLESLARAEIHSAESRKSPGPLTCQAAIFLGWRANQYGDRATGQRWARSALKLALAVVAPLGRRSAKKSTSNDRDLHQLGVAALNVAGFSPHPQPGGRLVIDRDRETLELLERAVSVLPAESEALPVLEIELEWLSGSLRPSNASLKKAKSLVEQARGIDKPLVAAMATQTFLRRFGRVIPTSTRIDYVHRVLDEDSNLSERLMLGFVEHQALLELGRLHEAASLVRGLWTEAKTLGSEVDIGAARVLTIRHYLWTGELGEAEQRLRNHTWADRPTPVDLAAIQVEQRTELGRLLAQSGHLEATNRELIRSTMEPATKAALLCQVGDLDRAQEFLDLAVERITIGRSRSVDEAAVARVATAASVLQRPSVAAAVLSMLEDLGDEMLVTNNNSILLGPASYYLGLAASTVGSRTLANEAFDRAVASALSSGGKPLAVQALVAQAKQAADYTDRDEVETLLRQAKELAVGLDLGWLDRQVI